eukprot:scaffold92557_cov57-Phaeocystis_antarctica.AAC.1
MSAGGRLRRARAFSLHGAPFDQCERSMNVRQCERKERQGMRRGMVGCYESRNSLDVRLRRFLRTFVVPGIYKFVMHRKQKREADERGPIVLRRSGATLHRNEQDAYSNLRG